MIEKRIRPDQIGERSFSFENEDFLINTCSDHACNLERIIKQNLTERALSPNEDIYRFFLRKIMQLFFLSILQERMKRYTL